MRLTSTAIAALLVCAAGDSAMARPTITAVRPDRTAAPIYERITLAIDLTADYQNPFDPEQVRVDALVRPAAGDAWTVPAFWWQPFALAQADGRETVEPAGAGAWLARLSLPAPGAYYVQVSVTDAGGTVIAPPVRLTATAADAPGFVRRSQTDHRYFVTDRGECFYPLGANVCWGDQRGTGAYDAWLPEYAAAGCNWIRVWLAPEWFTCALQTRASGFEGIDLGNAARLDHVVEECERLGLRAMLCIDSFNILRFKHNLYGSWEDSPYIAANGGPLAEPRGYFTNPAMLRAYRNRLRYLVARWGYSPAVFAWEFWNEVDIIDQFDAEAVAEWHQRMARELRAIDPWRHLITTSHARTQGIPVIDRLPELECVQSHHYGSRDMAADFLRDRTTKEAAADRPHFHGEFGISGDGRQTREVDPTGIHLRNAIFSSLGQEQAGAPMTWWWDSYVDPQDLYHVFAEFAAWRGDFDPVAQHARPIAAELSWADPAAPHALQDVVPALAGGSWEAAPFNQPATITIARDGTMQQTAPPSRVLHGLANHPTLHNPVTFELDVIEPTRLIVTVAGVSGHGGAALEVRLDGAVARREEFRDDLPDDTETMTRYDGDYAVELPAGRHTVVVENTGRDWFYVAYRIARLTAPAAPPLRVYGLTGDTAGRVWIQNPEFAWPRAVLDDFEPNTYDGCVLTISGLRPGRWTAVAWPPPQGLRPAVYPVGADGRLRLELIEITWDAAFRLEWQGE